MTIHMWKTICVLSFGSLFAFAAPVLIAGQGAKEYLTSQEIDQLKEAQEIDLRVKVLMKIAERRLVLIENPSAVPSKKEEAQWGALLKVTRAELLNQYVRAIDETIVNIEDAYSRTPDEKTLYKALKAFREATDQYLERLKAVRSTVKDENDLRALDRAIEATELANEDAKHGEVKFAKEKPKKKG